MPLLPLQGTEFYLQLFLVNFRKETILKEYICISESSSLNGLTGLLHCGKLYKSKPQDRLTKAVSTWCHRIQIKSEDLTNPMFASIWVFSIV